MTARRRRNLHLMADYGSAGVWDHDGAPLENRSQNPFAIRQFRSYVDRIRQFKIYLNTTLRSPI